MPIPTTRTKENGTVRIDAELCSRCGLCVEVCSDKYLVLNDGKVSFNDESKFGCIGCGHCMAVCPDGAITVSGREISPDDIFDLPPKERTANFEQLLGLLQRRRSVRNFHDRPVETEVIEKILEAARAAPMGLPPSDVHLLVFSGKEQVRKFAADYVAFLEGMKWFVSKWFLALMKPFWGRSADEMFKGFVRPLYFSYTENMNKGVNVVNYDAPLALYFYGSPYCDPADPIIAATYAMLAGESMGLGTCMLGAVHPMIQSGMRAKRFREAHGIRHKSREGLFVIFGYPKVKYKKGIRRTFAAEDHLHF